jgi:hypothetical protein
MEIQASLEQILIEIFALSVILLVYIVLYLGCEKKLEGVARSLGIVCILKLALFLVKCIICALPTLCLLKLISLTNGNIGGIEGIFCLFLCIPVVIMIPVEMCFDVVQKNKEHIRKKLTDN